MSDLVEKVAAAIIDKVDVPNAAARAAIAVVLLTANEWMKKHDYTFCGWGYAGVPNDTGKNLSDFARENGIDLK